MSQASRHAPILLKGSLTRFPDHYHLQLPNNKNRKTLQGFVVKYYRTNSNWCLIEVFDLCNKFAAAPLDSFLFPFPTHPLILKQFVSHFRILLVKLGLNPRQFSGHSFRIRAASQLPSRGSLLISSSTWGTEVPPVIADTYWNLILKLSGHSLLYWFNTF